MGPDDIDSHHSVGGSGTDASTAETFDIPLEVAEIYEERFVPAIFAQWAPRILAAAGVGASTRLLDVACGTGIVARTAEPLVGVDGRVVGLDRNEAMLTVARRCAPELEWWRGDAARLPFPDGSFDAVTCQMAMMFLPDRRAALVEFARIVAPGGRVALVVPASLDAQPAYGPFVDAAAERAGPEARSLLGAYWNCGDVAALAEDVAAAGLTDLEVETIRGTARFDSPADFVATEVGASPLAERVTADVAAAITADVERRLSRYAAGGRFDIPLVCHVVAMQAR